MIDVVFAPEAQDDLLELYRYIADRAGGVRAYGYTERIRLFCAGLAAFPDRGRRRDDLYPGLRVLGFERRVTIAFHLSPQTVTIDRILYGGRSLARLKR